MPEYRVTWSIDVDAETPEDAANEARSAQLAPDSLATVFEVTDEAGNTETVDVVEIAGD